MTAWTDLVKKVYNENKHKPGYKLGNAMKDASKMKKRSHTSKKHTATPYPVKGGGNCGVAPVNPFPDTAVAGGGGKSRRRRGGKKGGSHTSRRTKKCSM